MATESAQYLSTLHEQIDRYFNFSEVKTLCFNLGVNYENIPGSGRSAFIRNLIISLAKQNQLQELINLVRRERPFVNWQDVPAYFELPASMAQENIRQVVNYHVYGDYVGGDKVGGDKVGGDQISVGNMSVGQVIAIGSGASVMFDIGGVQVGSAQISVGNIRDSQGIAIGAGAMVHNETHHHYYGQSDEDESPKIEEAIRLDTAAPAEVFAKQPFDIAVAVRQPDSPQLAVADLPVVASESGSVFRSEAAEIIQYRIEVSGKDFVVKPESYTLKLRPGVDSRVCFFQVTPLQSGKKSLLINAYQENDVVAAQTRIQLAVAVKVSSETQFLRFLVGQLEVFLHTAPPERASVVKELKDGVNLLIQMAADSPNPALLKMMGDSLAGSSQKLEADSTGIIVSLERVVTAVVAMADSQI